MARVSIEDNQLVIRMQGTRKLWALKSELDIPLDSVTGVTTGLDFKEIPSILDKRAGANLLGFYYAGTFVQDGDRVFYDLKRTEDAVVVTLEDEEFKRIIIGVDNPQEVVELIENALK